MARPHPPPTARTRFFTVAWCEPLPRPPLSPSPQSSPHSPAAPCTHHHISRRCRNCLGRRRHPERAPPPTIHPMPPNLPGCPPRCEAPPPPAARRLTPAGSLKHTARAGSCPARTSAPPTRRPREWGSMEIRPGSTDSNPTTHPTPVPTTAAAAVAILLRDVPRGVRSGRRRRRRRRTSSVSACPRVPVDGRRREPAGGA